MPSLITTQRPFAVLPAGQRATTNPTDMWSNGSTTTYVYGFSMNPAKPVPYFAVWLHGVEFEEGFAAIIYGEALKGCNVGERYYVGHLDPARSSTFIKLRPIKEATAINIFVNIRLKSDVDMIAEENRVAGEPGCFLQLE